MSSPPPYRLISIGIPRTPLRDAYHAFLRMSWALALGLIVSGYLALNALFAAAYMITGGVQGAREGSFVDAYAFSIQTMGTIGYGAMYPTGGGAVALMIAESVMGLLVTALATGLVFAKFSRSTARIRFSKTAAIAPLNGVPTLSIRIGNERGNQIVDAALKVVLTRTERTAEGQTFYRMYDLKLRRDRAPTLTRAYVIMHAVDAESPLFGRSPEQLAQEEVELDVTIIGLDGTSIQTIYAAHQYLYSDILLGARHVDLLRELPSGDMEVDLRKFDHVEPSQPTEGFPYPTAGS